MKKTITILLLMSMSLFGKDIFIKFSQDQFKIKKDSTIDDLRFYEFDYKKYLKNGTRFSSCIIAAKNNKPNSILCLNKKNGKSYAGDINGSLDKDVISIYVPLVKLKLIKSL